MDRLASIDSRLHGDFNNSWEIVKMKFYSCFSTIKHNIIVRMLRLKLVASIHFLFYLLKTSFDKIRIAPKHQNHLIYI